MPTLGEDNLNILVTAENKAGGTIAELSAELAALRESVDSLNKSLEESAVTTQTVTKKHVDSWKTVETALSNVGTKMKEIGSTLTNNVTVPIVAIGGASVAMAAKFDQSMTQLNTLGGLSKGVVAGLKDEILAMAPAVGQGPDKLAEAMYHIASNSKGMLSSVEMLDQLRMSAEAASISGANLDDTTYALSSAMASSIPGFKNASDMMGALTAIVGAGDMKFQDLNAAIGTGFLATASQFGISIQSVGAALATLTDNGEHADEAATRLRMSITLMDAPSHQAAKILSALGLSGSEVKASTEAATQALADAHVTTTKLADDMRQPNGINVAFKDLRDHLQASGLSANAADAAIAKAFGGGRSDAAILTLLGNIDRTDEAFKKINGDTGKFNDLWATQQQIAAQKFREAWAGLQSDLIRLGYDLLPQVTVVMKDFAGAVHGVSDWFESLGPGMKQFVLDTTLIAAAAGPTLMVLGSFSKNLSSVIGLGRAVFGAGGMLAGAGAGAEGAAGAAAGIGGIGGALAAAAPAALALAPILGVVAYNLYDQAKAAKEVADATANATDLINKHGASQSLTKIFTEANNRAITEQKAAITGVNGAVAGNKDATKALGIAQTDLTKAQQGVADALIKYGQNSPQYQLASQQLADAQSRYRDAVHDASLKTLDLMGAQGRLKDANAALKDATGTLNSYLKDQNKSLGDIVKTISNMGPAADMQVKSIVNLGQNIATVVASFRNAQGELQAGLASDIGNFQGLGSTIDKLQNAAGNLQKTSSGLQTQGGSTNSLQGNYGTAAVKQPWQHATGGVFTSPHFSVTAEDGPEAIVPLSKPARAKQVMQEAGLGGTTIHQTNNIYSQVDMDSANRELGWRLQNA